MTQTEILEEFKKLALPERLRVVEAAIRLIRDDIHPEAGADQKQRLTAAAQALLPDYSAGGELTAFTTLDSEDFHAQG